MDGFIIFVELLVVLACIIAGTRSSGIALGLWGGVGVAILVFVFREPLGDPPVQAILIVLSVVVASSMMQQAGGIDWMVSIAARIIEKRPQHITWLAPLIAFSFSVGAGTSNILYPLLPVITDLSYQNGIRPSRPLSLSVVSTGVALGCSPVSAAMAVMVSFTDVSPYNFELIDILKVTLPSAIIGILITSIFVRKMGLDISKDPEIQAKIKSGEIPKPGGSQGKGSQSIEVSQEGRRAAIIFLLGVLAIVLFGLFKGLRPLDPEGDPLSMSPIISMTMLVAGTLILIFSKPMVSEIPKTSVFRAGMVSVIALFGLAWMTSTFISAHSEMITESIGGLVTSQPWIFALGVFVICVLTTSQSTATQTVVPIGLTAGLAPSLVAGMWSGAFAGIYVLPTNGSQIAAANFDYTGSTKLGTKLLDHSFFWPSIILALSAIIAGLIIGGIFA